MDRVEAVREKIKAGRTEIVWVYSNNKDGCFSSTSQKPYYFFFDCCKKFGSKIIKSDKNHDFIYPYLFEDMGMIDHKNFKLVAQNWYNNYLIQQAIKSYELPTG